MTLSVVTKVPEAIATTIEPYGRWMIAMIYQDSDLRQVHRLRLEIVHSLLQHLNQARIVCNVCSCTVAEEWKAQRIYREMVFDAIRGFVVTEPFGIHTSVGRQLSPSFRQNGRTRLVVERCCST
jgi:hypothetical protein